ncbi:MAG TPA: glycosyltransferase [Streptosporangiaceae bacterium]|jgi:cellulose synthase/poly-beta-1,6-N-acetylglucosamine synthase-like glycosyltransferase
MLEALLLAGLVAAPLGSAGLFMPARRRRRAAGFWPAARRLTLAVAGTALLAAAVAVALQLLSVSRPNLIAGVAGIIAASAAWLPVTRRWNGRAHLCWASSVFLFVIYLAFALDWTLTSGLGLASTAGGVVLWLLEVFAAILTTAYLWEICDALGTEHWRRRVTATTPLKAGHQALAGQQPYLPFVSLHVPAHNEPPDMVIETLGALLRLDYPAYEVVLIDDNTSDERLWRPVEQWCARHGVTFAHLEDWPGYKSGALNYALRELTDPRAEVIGVVDSDYQIEPGFLRRCAPAFADPWTGFIQAPQDYRDWRHAPYYRRLYYSYKYFFAVSQPARNEHDGAIFAGTMGLIRRVALDELGGWDEWCITEDAELSLRLLRAGWNGLHMDQTWGRGIMPLTFEALKGQRYRWCFGGIQILRMHWRSLLPRRASRGNHLTTAQRWAYLAGGIQWYGDLLSLVFLVFLLAGAANLAAGGGELFRKLTPFLVATVPVLVGLGLVRAVALLRRGTGASWRDAIGAFFIWQSTSVVVARASVQGLFARKAAFLRTPKTSEQAKWWEPLRANWAESALAVLGLAGIAAALTKPAQLSGPLLAFLLAFPTAGLAAAPVNSWAAQRAALPRWLRARRQTEYLRNQRSVAAGAAAGGAVAVLAAVLIGLALIFAPSQHQFRSPDLVGPAQGHSHGPASPDTRSPSPSGSPSGSSSSGSSPSGSSSSPASTSPAPVPSTSSPVPTATPSPTATSTTSPPASP